ncbi:MAG TPA: nucleotide exchange factor GrpE [Acidobacteria bacterium]|jgi:molecular chaperone GrpE|nr:nucleotide exchange factor GrpE [Acidobacteriota bacterium]
MHPENLSPSEDYSNPSPELVPEITEIEALRASEKELREQYLRLAADFKNYQNRVTKDIQLSIELSEKKILLEALQSLDSLDRCLATNYQEVPALQQDINLIHKQLTDSLKRLGLEPLKIQVGDLFDASHAEALTIVHQPDLADNSIFTVFEKGYTLRGQLLRPARVVVNRHLDLAPPDSSTPSV